MHAVTGFLALQLLLLGPGFAVLYAIRLLEAPGRSWLYAVGPAYLSGVALVLPLLIALTVVGVRLAFLTLLLAAAAGTGALAFLGTWVRRSRLLPPFLTPSADRQAGSFERWLSRIGIALVVAWVVLVGFWVRNLVAAWDDSHIWSFKALGLYYYGHLNLDLFRVPLFAGAHLDYPILQPVLEAELFHSMGRVALQTMHLELWILFVAFLWTAGFLLGGGRIRTVWLPVIAALAVAPGVYDFVIPGFADVTVSAFLAAGALSLALWIDRGHPGYALLGGLFMGAAANTKNEGLVYGAIGLVVAGAVAFGVRERRFPRWWLAACVIAIAAVIPWRIWIHAHHLKSTDVTPLSTALNWDFLTGRLFRLRITFEAILFRFQNQDVWVWFVPAFLMAAVMAFITGVAKRLALFWLASVLLATAALSWIYWTSPVDIREHLNYSVDRTVTGIVFLCALGLAHLGSLLLPPRLARRARSEGAEPAGASRP